MYEKISQQLSYNKKESWYYKKKVLSVYFKNNMLM